MRVKGCAVGWQTQRPRLQGFALCGMSRSDAPVFRGRQPRDKPMPHSPHGAGVGPARKHGLRQMTCKISRSVFAFALALGMLAALSNPSRAALSNAERKDAAVAAAPAPEQATVAAVTAQQPATPPAAPAPAPVAATAPATPAAAAPVAVQPRKSAAKVTPRRFASGGRFGYPCH
jgi:hypothetical protein